MKVNDPKTSGEACWFTESTGVNVTTDTNISTTWGSLLLVLAFLFLLLLEGKKLEREGGEGGREGGRERQSYLWCQSANYHLITHALGTNLYHL